MIFSEFKNIKKMAIGATNFNENTMNLEKPNFNVPQFDSCSFSTLFSIIHPTNIEHTIPPNGIIILDAT